MNFNSKQLQWIFNEAKIVIACKYIIDPILGQVYPQDEEMEKLSFAQVPSSNLNTLVNLVLRGYDTRFQNRFKGLYGKYL
nr:hypothetical protein [uncultured Cellulosilyticum sp.]